MTPYVDAARRVAADTCQLAVVFVATLVLVDVAAALVWISLRRSVSPTLDACLFIYLFNSLRPSPHPRQPATFDLSHFRAEPFARSARRMLCDVHLRGWASCTACAGSIEWKFRAKMRQIEGRRLPGCKLGLKVLRQRARIGHWHAHEKQWLTRYEVRLETNYFKTDKLLKWCSSASRQYHGLTTLTPKKDFYAHQHGNG